MRVESGGTDAAVFFADVVRIVERVAKRASPRDPRFRARMVWRSPTVVAATHRTRS